MNDGARPRHRFRAAVISLVAMLAGACAPQAPTAAPSAIAAIPTPSPTPAAIRTLEPTPTPLASPSIECGLPPVSKGAYLIQLNCDGAIAAALAALSVGHPAIRSFLFGWGAYCPPLTPCPTPAILLETGYVVVTYVDGSAALLTVQGKAKQTVVVTRSEPLPAVGADAAELPNPGGTCDASQFIAGIPTSSYEMSTISSRMASAFVPLTNTGATCVLGVPPVIGMADSTGRFVAIGLSSEGQDVCVKSACKTIYPTSYRVPSGAAVEVSVRAWWPMDLDLATAPPAGCGHPLIGVTRAEIPFAVGEIEFNWNIAFENVCPREARVGLTVRRT